ncbi:MAG TPA: hypothetical protein VL354_03330 [Spirochaetia bacterium]|nr:hypothetical protein [Spirochaetia bacterium]
MANSNGRGSAYLRDAKEFAQFCRVRGVFMVDGLEHWRAALKAKGTPDEVVSEKVSAAARFIRNMGDPLSEHGGV